MGSEMCIRDRWRLTLFFMSAPRSALAVRRERALAVARAAQASAGAEAQTPPKRVPESAPESTKRRATDKAQGLQSPTQPEPRPSTHKTEKPFAPPPVFAMRLGTDANTIIEPSRAFVGVDCGECLIIQGICSVRVLRGTAELAGARLSNESMPSTCLLYTSPSPRDS